SRPSLSFPRPHGAANLKSPAADVFERERRAVAGDGAAVDSARVPRDRGRPRVRLDGDADGLAVGDGQVDQVRDAGTKVFPLAGQRAGAVGLGSVLAGA